MGATVTLVRAYRFALDPTAVQEGMLRSHCGAQRYTYNWGLAMIKANLGQRPRNAPTASPSRT